MRDAGATPVDEGNAYLQIAGYERFLRTAGAHYVLLEHCGALPATCGLTEPGEPALLREGTPIASGSGQSSPTQRTSTQRIPAP